MNKFKIKEVIRTGILETNSSSSHSLTISRLNGELSEFIDLDIQQLDDGRKIIYVESPKIEFGRNYFKTNSCSIKIQYACGLAIVYYEEAKIPVIKEIIKSMTGVDDVIFQWEEDFKAKIKDHEEHFWINVPSIDHQSTDLFYQVFENQETIKNFIFNPNSWLIGGGDEDEEHVETTVLNLDSSEEFNYIASFNAGGQIGEIDFRIPYKPCQEDLLIFEIRDVDILKGLYWDTKTLLPDYEPSKPFNFFTNEEEDINKIRCLRIINKSEIEPDYYILATNRSNFDVNSIDTIDSFKNLLKSRPDLQYLIIKLHLYSEKFGKIL